MIPAAVLVWALVVLVGLLSLLLAVAVLGNRDLAAENRRLRGDHLRLVHPSTRRTAR